MTGTPTTPTFDYTFIKQKCKTHLDLTDLEINLKPEWSSDNEQHRIQIRQGLVEYCSSNNIPYKSETLDLSNHCNWLVDGSASISHCTTLGGFITSPTKSVGLDLEPLDKATSTKSVARISKNQELENLPNPLHLWVAKESAFKSFQKLEEIKLISHVFLQSSRRIDEKCIYFKYLASNSIASGEGLIFLFETAIAISKSNT